jgi:hypothetical protein
VKQARGYDGMARCCGVSVTYLSNKSFLLIVNVTAKDNKTNIINLLKLFSLHMIAIFKSLLESIIKSAKLYSMK